MKCETLEEIGRKLELFNNYNAQIMAVKQQYNQEQMMHTMDEAREFGEKIAEAAEKLEAKTPEERKREQIEEALGIEDEDGLLTEVLEESLDKMILLEEELAEEVSEEDLENMESMENAEMVPGIVQQEELTQEYLETKYTPFDMKA
jgi:Small-conductance mechanosensitive channel